MPKTYAASSQTFHLTALDKEILAHCQYDLDLWVRGYFDGQAFPYQRYFYHAPQKDKLLVAGIRTGKSRLVSMGFLHFAQYHAHARLLNTSISSEQAKIVYQNCLEYCSHPRFQHWVERVQSSPYPLIRLVNGAELWFRSIGYEAELIRGFEFDLINVDEAAYVTRPTAIKTLKGRLLGYNTMTGAPRLGIFWQVSSPKGQGPLAERWKRGDPQFVSAEPHKYLSLRATIWDNPLLDQESIQDLMADYTENMIRQEMLGEFLDNMDAVFPYQLVMAACNDEEREVRQILDQIRFFQARKGEQEDWRVQAMRKTAGVSEDLSHYECEPQAGHRYVNSWDLGKKPTRAGRNAMVGQVWDITHEPWSMVAYLYKEGMGYLEAKSMMEGWHEKYSGNGAQCKTAFDATGKGDVLQEFIEAERTIDKLEGIVYSGVNKPNLIHAGKIALEKGQVRFPFIRRMVDQLTNYELLDKDLAQDIVMCYCQAMWVARSMLRLTDKSISARTLSSLYSANHRIPQARLLNPRYVESRMQARVARALTRAGTRVRRTG